ncbi:MAG: amidohydrolase [Christensenellales bacterium]|nr:amidohydrolase [Christensenellales bacterium]
MKRLFENADILAWEGDTFRYISKGYLGIDGDTICFVGAKRPEEHFDETRDMTGKVLMPGLVNSHCHAAMVLLRGVGSDLPLDRWLYEKVFPIEGRMKPEDVAAGNELAMMEMIASGVTSFTDMYMEPATLIEVNERVGMKVNVCRVIQSFSEGDRPEDCAAIQESIDLYEKMNGAQEGRVKIDFAVHAEYTCTDAIAAGYAERIRPYIGEDARIHIHLSETEKEHSECIQRHGMTPTAWFEKMGILDLPACAAHCVEVTPEDIAILKRRGASIMHNPTSNMKLGSGFAPIPELLKAGINVTLGTDGAASNNNLNMFEEMHLAAIITNGYRRDAVLMPPEQVLKMATVNGAKLQGREDTGCLQVGKKADVIAVDFRNKPHLYPAIDPVSLLVYSAQASDVCMTMVDGKILYEDGKYTTLDPDRVYGNVKAAMDRLYVEK